MSELPSGTLTFLFTDIEGSTRLLRQLRDRYSAVLADHRRLLRAAFQRYSGEEIGTEGDSFFVVAAPATPWLPPPMRNARSQRTSGRRTRRSASGWG